MGGVPALTRAERAEYGQAERKRVRRSEHAWWEAAADRDAPAMVAERERGRVPSLLPLRHERMSSSAFAFFRGSADVMAADLARTPTTHLMVQLCGDAHAANYGIFGAPDRNLVFDCNDFDETARGPFEWDVKRLAASLVLAADDADLGAAVGAGAAEDAVRAYGHRIAEYADLPTLDVWYARIDPAAIDELADAERHFLQHQTRRARVRSGRRAIRKWVRRTENGDITFREAGTTLRRLDVSIDAAEAFLAEYRATLPAERAALMRRFRVRDIAAKVVGVGSVGLRNTVMLLDGGDPTDALILQVKEAVPSVVQPYVPYEPPSHQGERVVRGQKLIQAAGDVLLGWARLADAGREFYVRQLWDMKGDLDLTTVDEHGLRLHAALCGWAMARAHARTGDPIAITGYLGGGGRFTESVVTFAEAYAQTMRSDHTDFVAALAAAPAGRDDVDEPVHDELLVTA
jgi:uncharacterized protein (DUF2252 family)